MRHGPKSQPIERIAHDTVQQWYSCYRLSSTMSIHRSLSAEQTRVAASLTTLTYVVLTTAFQFRYSIAQRDALNAEGTTQFTEHIVLGAGPAGAQTGFFLHQSEM